MIPNADPRPALSLPERREIAIAAGLGADGSSADRYNAHLWVAMVERGEGCPVLSRAERSTVERLISERLSTREAPDSTPYPMAVGRPRGEA